MLHADCRLSKASPIKWLESFLTEYSPECKEKFVVLDQSGELYQSVEVRNLFSRFKYTIIPTGSDASFQNGPVERSHCTIGEAVKACLHGAGLDIKFWPYALQHVVCICNAIPGYGQEQSPLFLARGHKDNFKNLKVFGCRVWVQPPGIQAHRFPVHACKGIFLVYIPHTDRLI